MRWSISGLPRRGCRHIHDLSCLQLGIDPDGSIKADEDRRKEKATILREFAEEVEGIRQQGGVSQLAGQR